METGGGGTGGGAGGPAAALNFVFDVPCRAPGNCGVGANGENDPLRVKTVTKMLGGNPATTYTVKLKICAVSEQRSFTGCMTSMAGSPFVCMDGAIGGPATYPAVSMTVSEPMHKYYLNNGGTRDDLRLEYSATFEMKGGSTITFNTNGGSNPDVYTAKWKGHNYTCAGAPGIMQPFEGQFFWFQGRVRHPGDLIRTYHEDTPMKKHLFLVSPLPCFACTPPPRTKAAPAVAPARKAAPVAPPAAAAAAAATGGSSSTGGSTGGSILRHRRSPGRHRRYGRFDGGTGGSGGSGGSTGGTGGSTGGTGGSTGGTGGGMTDAKPADTGGGAETGAPAGGVASALHDQVFKVACPNQSGMAASCTVGANGANDPLRSFTKEFAIGGDPNKVYKVTLKFCGAVRRPQSHRLRRHRQHAECLRRRHDGQLTELPAHLPDDDRGRPEPKHIYHLNRKFRNDRSRSTTTSTPSTSRVAPRSRSSPTAATTAGIYTPYKSGAMTCPTVPGIAMQPFLGQFFHVQLVKADPMQ